MKFKCIKRGDKGVILIRIEEERGGVDGLVKVER